jgi:hypothetical protein
MCLGLPASAEIAEDALFWIRISSGTTAIDRHNDILALDISFSFPHHPWKTTTTWMSSSPLAQPPTILNLPSEFFSRSGRDDVLSARNLAMAGSFFMARRTSPCPVALSIMSQITTLLQGCLSVFLFHRILRRAYIVL